MKKQSNLGLFFFITMLVIALILVVLSFGYSPKARAFPLVIGIPVVGLCILQVGAELRIRRSAQFSSFTANDDESDNHVKTSRYALIVASIALLLSALTLLGYLYGVALFAFCYLKFLEKQSWVVSIIYTFVLTLSIYLIFVFGLKTYLYQGLLLS